VHEGPGVLLAHRGFWWPRTQQSRTRPTAPSLHSMDRAGHRQPDHPVCHMFAAYREPMAHVAQMGQNSEIPNVLTSQLAQVSVSGESRLSDVMISSTSTPSPFKSVVRRHGSRGLRQPGSNYPFDQQVDVPHAVNPFAVALSTALEHRPVAVARDGGCQALFTHREGGTTFGMSVTLSHAIAI
jgi:hypothetical protein